jgi:hypothetical protein
MLEAPDERKMADNKSNPKRSGNLRSPNPSEAAPRRRAKRRKPPLADRVVVTGPVVVPPAPGAPLLPLPRGTGAVDADALVSAPPRMTIPVVPSGFVPPNPADLLGFRALPAQVAAVTEAIDELEGFASYQAVFGIAAPDAGQLAQRLRVASQWTEVLSQTAAWHEYVKARQGVAWKTALLMLDGLKRPFALASAADPTLLLRYPATARLLEAKSTVARRSAASRAKKATEQGPSSSGADGA